MPRFGAFLCGFYLFCSKYLFNQCVCVRVCDSNRAVDGTAAFKGAIIETRLNRVCFKKLIVA